MPLVHNEAENAFIEVANYSALPAANLNAGKTYVVLNSQGTPWIGGLWGGTYYGKGLYYSDGTDWIYTDTPYNATQAIVDAGTNNDQFVTPLTLRNSTQFQYLDATSSIQSQLNLKSAIPIYSGKWISHPFVATSFSNIGVSIGAVAYTPIPINGSIIITDISTYVITAFTGGNYQLAIYSDNNGLPGTLLGNSTNIPTDTTGNKTFTFASPITYSGKLIWAGIMQDNSSSRVYGGQGIQLLSSSGGTNNNKSFGETTTYGVWPATSAATPGAGSQYAIQLKIQ